MEPWLFLPIGYLFSVLIETPILLAGLSPCHSFKRKLFAGIWLTACTYPIVVIVLPQWFDPTDDRVRYLIVAETFAPVAECLLFFLAFWQWSPGFGLNWVPEKPGIGDREATGDSRALRSLIRDMIAVTAANLASFVLGELFYFYVWPQF